MGISPLISVIVPVYNVERYLPRCIESILAQTYTNFELILVDDGTPDRSGDICDSYALNDSRIKVIHKENGGVSTARNAGIDAANGAWITFVDSDDWISKDCLSILISPIFEYEYDFVISSIEIRNLKVIPSLLNTESIIFSENDPEHTIELISKPRFYGPFAKMYRATILKTKNIKFPIGIKNGEDKIFVAEYLKYCHSMKTLKDITYFYNRLNESSVTQRFNYAKELPEWIKKYLQEFANVCDAYNVKEECKNNIVSKLTFSHLYSYMRNCAKNLNKKEAKHFINSGIEELLPWLTLGDTWEHSGIGNLLAIPLKNRDVIAVYNICKRRAWLSKIKWFVRHMRIKMFGSLIEKTRDEVRA